MITDARTRVRCLLFVATFSLCSVVCTESQAQPGQWLLGVRTETVDVSEHYLGDRPGGGGVQQPPPFYALRIVEVVKDSAADKDGLKKGDVIVAINDRRVIRPADLSRLVKGSNGVVKVRLKDRTIEAGFKDKTINLRGGALPAAGTPAAGEVFVPHIGIYYQKVPYQDGTFGARLTRDAVPGSPTTQLRIGSATQLYRLEKGDTIIEMDGNRFRTDDDFRNHRAETTMRFIDLNTGQVVDAALTLP